MCGCGAPFVLLIAAHLIPIEQAVFIPRFPSTHCQIFVSASMVGHICCLHRLANSNFVFGLLLLLHACSLSVCIQALLIARISACLPSCHIPSSLTHSTLCACVLCLILPPTSTLHWPSVKDSILSLQHSRLDPWSSLYLSSNCLYTLLVHW